MRPLKAGESSFYVVRSGHLRHATGDKIKEPKSWNVLWDPKYKNLISISGDHYESNLEITGLSMGLRGTEFYSYDKLNNQAVKNKLKALADNVFSFWEGVDTASHLRGMVLATSWGFSIPELKRLGENWKIADPKKGTMGFVDNYMIGAHLGEDSFRYKVAHEFFNYVLSPQYQYEVFVKGIASFPVNLKTKSLMTPQERLTFHIDDPNYFKNNRIRWPTLSKRDRNGLKKIWYSAVGDVVRTKKDLKKRVK